MAAAGSRSRRLAWARGPSADTCGAVRTTRRASRRSTRRWTTASTGSTPRRSTARATPRKWSGERSRRCRPSQRPLIFTKFGLGIDSNAPTRSASAAEVAAECDASLRRLGVEQIDLYQLHWPAPATDCRNGGGLPGAARGRQDPRDRRLELLGGAARGVAGDRRPAAHRSAAVQHPPSRRQARRAAVVRGARRRRHLLLAALPRPAVRDLDEGQDLPARRRAEHAQGLFAGARFQRHLQAIEAIREVASSGGLSVRAARGRRAAPDARPHRRHRRRARTRGRAAVIAEPRHRRHRRTGGRGLVDCRTLAKDLETM